MNTNVHACSKLYEHIYEAARRVFDFRCNKGVEEQKKLNEKNARPTLKGNSKIRPFPVPRFFH